jgi:hypothetical protein
VRNVRNLRHRVHVCCNNIVASAVTVPWICATNLRQRVAPLGHLRHWVTAAGGSGENGATKVDRREAKVESRETLRCGPMARITSRDARHAHSLVPRCWACHPTPLVVPRHPAGRRSELVEESVTSARWPSSNRFGERSLACMQLRWSGGWPSYVAIFGGHLPRWPSSFWTE